MGSKIIRDIRKVFKSASGVLFGRATAGDGPGEELTPSQARTLLDVPTNAQMTAAVAAKIGGSVGATTNRLVKSIGTDTLTVTSTGITVDGADNVSGIGTLSCGAITASNNVSAAQFVSKTSGTLLNVGNSAGSVVDQFSNSGTGRYGNQTFYNNVTLNSGAVLNAASSSAHTFGTGNTVTMTAGAIVASVSGKFGSSSNFCDMNLTGGAGSLYQNSGANITNYGNSVGGTIDSQYRHNGSPKSLLRTLSSGVGCLELSTDTGSGMTLRFAVSGTSFAVSLPLLANGGERGTPLLFAALPAASASTDYEYIVSDRTNRPKVKSDGTNWRNFFDGTILT